MEAIPGDERVHRLRRSSSIALAKEIARYRKHPSVRRHHAGRLLRLQGARDRSKAARPVVTYDCEGMTIGCAICYDLRFPDLFMLQAFAEKGAQIDRPAGRPSTLQSWQGSQQRRCCARAPSRRRPTFAPRRETGSFTDRQRAARDLRPHSLVADPWGPCRRQGVRRRRRHLDPARHGAGRSASGRMIPVAQPQSGRSRATEASPHGGAQPVLRGAKPAKSNGVRRVAI